MKKLILILACFIFIPGNASPQKNNKDNTDKNTNSNIIFIAQWNLENLFNVVDDIGKNDEEFLPTGEKHWTEERLDKKLYNLARVIRSMNENKGPDILSVCEVEHKTLLDSLTKKFLHDRNYKVAYYESPDERGIDNGLIYDADKFKLISVIPDTIFLPNGDETRLILNANLLFKNDTLRVFVNHWPSRRGGAEKSEPNRILAAKTLKDHLNKIAFDKSKVLIMGDFNDEPANNSILKTLDAQPFICDKKSSSNKINLTEFELFNVSYSSYKNGLGTYRYKEDWNMLDQIIISSDLINGDINYTCGSFEIYKPYFLTTHTGKYKGTAFPTYGGNRYLGGYSDHFPVIAKFIFDNKK